MGVCWCKQKHEEHDTYVPQQHHSNNHNINATIQPVSPVAPQYYIRVAKAPDPHLVDKLVLETLGVIATLVDK